jgi:hypothetical protein
MEHSARMTDGGTYKLILQPGTNLEKIEKHAKSEQATLATMSFVRNCK